MASNSDLFERPLPVATVTRDQQYRVNALLGRKARGLRAVAVTGTDGQPVVIQVASLVDNRPFPTLFWLVDPALNYRIDQLEAQGCIAALQARVDKSGVLRSSMAADHAAYIQLRNRLMTVDDRARLEALGFYDALQTRGVGGIKKTDRIRCLHTWYAAHLVRSNTIGRLVEEFWTTTP